MSFFPMAGICYHCKNCKDTLMVPLESYPEVTPIQIGDEQVWEQTDLNEKYSSELPLFHKEDCLCDACVKRFYPEYILERSQIIRRLMEIQGKCYEECEFVVERVSKVIDVDISKCYKNISFEDYHIAYEGYDKAIEFLLHDKNIRDEHRQKKCIKKYLRETYVKHQKKVYELLDKSATEKTLKKYYNIMERFEDKFYELKRSKKWSKSDIIITKCPTEGDINLNPYISGWTILAHLQPKALPDEKNFYETMEMSVREFEFRIPYIDIKDLYLSHIDCQEYHNLLKACILAELQNRLSQSHDA